MMLTLSTPFDFYTDANADFANRKEYLEKIM